MTEDQPVRYKHDIRDDVDELERFHDLEREKDGDDAWTLLGDEILVEARDFGLDFNDGRVVCKVRVETPHYQVLMLAREIQVYGIGFTVISHHDSTERLRVHGMGGH